MSRKIVSRESQGERGSRRAFAAGAITAAASAGIMLVSGTAHAAGTPGVQVTFTPAAISAGTQPDLTFTSQNAPSGALFILQESTDGGAQWKSLERTSNTAGSTYLPAASAGRYAYRLLMTKGSTVLAVSAPEVLTVTSPGGAAKPALAPSPTATAAPASAPSSTGLPWIKFIVKPLWDAIIGAIIAWVFAGL